MNNYEDWAKLVAKRLKGEADIIAAIQKDELELSAANAAPMTVFDSQVETPDWRYRHRFAC